MDSFLPRHDFHFPLRVREDLPGAFNFAARSAHYFGRGFGRLTVSAPWRFRLKFPRDSFLTLPPFPPFIHGLDRPRSCSGDCAAPSATCSNGRYGRDSERPGHQAQGGEGQCKGLGCTPDPLAAHQGQPSGKERGGDGGIVLWLSIRAFSLY